MGTGQMLTVIVAITLLGIVGLTNNSMMLSKTETMLNAEASLDAISFAQSLIDEIMSKSYDLATISAKVYTSSDFTAASGLGPNFLEQSIVSLPDSSSPFRSIKYYNDVDDYNGYKRAVSSPRMGKFFLNVSIYYVSEQNPDLVSTSQTFHKKIVVTVTHPNVSKPIQLADISVYRRYF